MNPTERLLAALGKRGYEPQRSGEGWTSRCPAHDDTSPSLSIGTGDNGGALLTCHAGCSTADVLVAVGLQLCDLMPRIGTDFARSAPPLPIPITHASPNGAARGGSGDGNAGDARRYTFPTAAEGVAELERLHGPHVSLWIYHDTAGEPVGLVVRWDTPTGKDIRPVSRIGEGWCICGMPTPRPLYGLPDLLGTPAGSRVYVTEGEKAADAARAVGLVATTSPHGSKSAAKTDWSLMAGRDVVILPDHDEAGEKYAEDVARLAHKAGARSVRVVRLVEEWPDLPTGGDMADALELADGDVDPVRTTIEARADDAEPVSFPVTPLACDPTGNDFVVVSIADLGPSEEPDWLWPGYLAGGAISLLTGLWKGGKTTLLAHLLRDLFVGGGLVETPIDSPVLLVSEEPNGLWSRRRDKLTLDPRILLRQRKNFARPSMADWHRLLASIVAIVEERDIGLVIIDTLAGTWPVENENDASEVMNALAPVRDISQTGASVLLVHHPRKGEGAHFTAARGSGALSGFPDILIELGRASSDNGSTTQRVLKAVGRFENIPPETVIDLQPEGYVVLGERLTVKRGGDLNIIGDLLPADGSPATWENIRARWPASPMIGERRLRGLLNAGAAKGHWLRSGAGVRNDAFRYRAIPAETDSFPVGRDTRGGTGNETPDDGRRTR